METGNAKKASPVPPRICHLSAAPSLFTFTSVFLDSFACLGSRCYRNWRCFGTQSSCKQRARCSHSHSLKPKPSFTNSSFGKLIAARIIARGRPVSLKISLLFIYFFLTTVSSGRIYLQNAASFGLRHIDEARTVDDVIYFTSRREFPSRKEK